MRRLPRCGPSVPVRRPPAVTRPFASIPGRDWRTLAYQPGAQWKPRLDERVAIWLAKQKRSMDADGLPVSEADLLKGSRRAFYVVSELMNPLLEKKDLPGDDQLRMLFTNVMVRWFHEYRAEYSLEARRARKEQEERQAEEEEDDDVLPVEDEMPVLWESKHEVMDVALLRWEENQGIVKYTTAARYPHPISGRMLFDHLWLFKYAVPRGATTNEKHFLLHEIVWPEL